MDNTATWPAVNTLVNLQGSGWEGDAPSRVEDCEGDVVVLAAPSDPNDALNRLLQPRPESVLRVSWVHPRGMSEVRAELVTTQLHPMPQWRVRAMRPPEQIQRREAVRVPLLLDLAVRIDGESYRATTVDVSEGGMRCIAIAFDNRPPGQQVELDLELEGEPFRPTAELIRTRPAHDDFTEMRLRFVGLSPSDAKRLRKYLFAQQIAQRNRARNDV